MTIEKYKKIVANFFPNGRAWERVKEGFLIEGIAWEFSRVGDAIDLLQKEIFPQTTNAMITDFETMLNIDNSTLSIEERRLAVIDKLSKKNSMSLSEFLLVASILNFNVTITFQYPFRVGINRIGDRLYNLDWQYYIFIEVDTDQITTLKDSLNKIKPAYTELVFFQLVLTETSSVDLPTSYYWALERSDDLGLFVTAEVGGNFYHSNDGINWTLASGSLSSDWRGISWSQSLGLFCAVNSTYATNNNSIATSPDGINWTYRATSTNIQWQDVKWCAGISKFVAVSSSYPNSNIAYSSDGINWTQITALTAVSGSLYCIGYSPELNLIVVGSQGGYLSTSPDGITWTQRTPPELNGWRGIAWSPKLSLFVAVSFNGTNRVAYSSDGITWSTSSGVGTNNSWASVTWSEELELFCAVSNFGDNRSMFSKDGINWTSTDDIPDSDYRNVVWSSSLKKFAAIASAGQTQRFNIFGFEKNII